MNQKTPHSLRRGNENKAQGKSLPDGWVIAPLSKLVERRSQTTDPADNPITKYIGLEHIESGGTRRLLGHGLAGEVMSNKTIFERGDILFGKLRPYLRKVVCAEFDGVCSTDILVLRPTKAIEPTFLACLLASPEIAIFSVGESRGLSLPRIKWAQLSSYEFPVPPLAEQRRIVAQLEILGAQSQRARRHLDDVPIRLCRTRQSLLAAAFSGRLTAGWRQSRNPNWPILSLREVVAELQQGWSPRCNDFPASTREWGIIKTTAIQPMAFFDAKNKALPLHFSPKPFLEIKKGDVLITRKGPRARAGVTAFVYKTRRKLMVCDTVYRLRVIPSTCEPIFLAYLLNSPAVLEEIDKLKSGVSESGVGFTQADFLALVVALPPLQEQREIIRRLDSAFARIDAAAVAQVAAIADLDRLDQSILNRAFRGQLVNQDHNDEPANILFDRLANEAAAKPEEPKKRMPRKTKSSAIRKIRSIMDVLRDANSSVSPEDLFHRSGRDETDLEQIEKFYTELRQCVNDSKVMETRPNKATVLLTLKQ